MLVQHGTLNVGDYVVVGAIYGKIKAMFNDKGKAIRKAPPSTPASILGLVRRAAERRHPGGWSPASAWRVSTPIKRETSSAASLPQRLQPPLDLGDLSQLIAAGAVKELDIVLKADVQGSLEPIVNSLKKLGDEKENVQVKLLASGHRADHRDAMSAWLRPRSPRRHRSAAMVIGFNVEPDTAAQRTAEMQGVEIRTFKVIYDIIDAIEQVVKGLYEPKYGEVADGHAEVRQVFKLSKGVDDRRRHRQRRRHHAWRPGAGAPQRQCGLRRPLSSLRRFKDDVREVTSGFECGITLDGFNEFQEKDIVETYHKERIN